MQTPDTPIKSKGDLLRHIAKTEGRIWIGGEMEFPVNATVADAYKHCAHIAEECGYIVGRKGSDRLEIAGGDLGGFVVCDWFGGDTCQKIEFWHAENVYLSA